MDDIQNPAKQIFLDILDGKRPPTNILLFGPSGSQKTCMVDVFLSSFYKTQMVREECSWWFNSSTNDSGTVKFAATCKDILSLRRDQHKWIVIDEASNMTDTTQTALRNNTEAFSKTTSFICMCNHASQIVTAMHSRFASTPVNRLSSKELVQILDKICLAEDIVIDTDVQLALIELSKGDVRKMLKQFQDTYNHVLFEHQTQTPPPQKVARLSNSPLLLPSDQQRMKIQITHADLERHLPALRSKTKAAEMTEDLFLLRKTPLELSKEYVTCCGYLMASDILSSIGQYAHQHFPDTSDALFKMLFQSSLYLKQGHGNNSSTIITLPSIQIHLQRVFYAVQSLS